MGRAPCCDKANVKKGPWSPEEDAKLKAYIDKYGTGGNWIALPQKIGLKRCGKSCRLRWLNYLRPNIKHGGFTEEEDNIICSLYISIGSRWSIIAAQLPGRTDNDIKNYWNTRLKKKLLGRRKQTSQMNRLALAAGGGQDSIKDANGGGSEDGSFSQTLSNSALERLQLHMQLQTLQNPFSFYSNPALWPKLSPLQEKMVQTLQCLNQNRQHHQGAPSDPNPHEPQQVLGQKLELRDTDKSSTTPNNYSLGIQQDYYKFTSSSDQELANSLNIVSPSESSAAAFNNGNLGQAVSTFSQTELDDLLKELNSKSAAAASVVNGDGPVSGLIDHQCFIKEMEGSRDSLMWWSNEFETNSASSSSWDSTTTPVLPQSDGGLMFQDYAALGYSMQ